MDTIVLILILLTAFNFLLKQTFWKPVAVGAAAGIATIFVILMLSNNQKHKLLIGCQTIN